MTDTPITDDYVAEILQRDAKRNGQSRYLASGLGSLLGGGRSRDKNAPKPNTRFLKNLVRDADSHNAALKKKEEEDSRVRLRGLRDEEQKSRRRERSRERDDDRHKRRREGLSPREKDLKKSRHRSRSRERRREHRRSRSPERESACSRKGRDHGSRRDRSPDERKSAHSRHDGSQRRDRSPVIEHEASDSDPLESVIGPKPPPKVKPRGRGAHKDSTMDSRFDPGYDPRADVAPGNSDDDDWDMALEALRDRAKWRKSGADRLRAAGFTEDEVSKWEKGGGSRADGGEKDVSDVRWSKRGEKREWDRGKVVDDGRVDVKADWGRLKDT